MDESYIFTFGWDHINPISGKRLNNSYVKLYGTYDSTREEMIHRFGNRWAQQYLTEKDAGVDRFNLIELKLGE